MTDYKHSPAPWVAAGPFAVLDAERNTLVKCAGPNKAANQQLIAAAPDLLEACEDIWQAWSSGDDAGRDLIEPINAARRAIAKAKGEAE